MPPLFDLAWRQRALLGDADAVRQLGETVLPPLYAFCLYRVGRDMLWAGIDHELLPLYEQIEAEIPQREETRERVNIWA